MMVDDSQELLREYSGSRSESAFRALVRKHSGLVYGTALRKLAGDKAAAEDVTQEVFALLARKAGKLQQVTLSGWLYCQTCRRAANHVRSESRRRDREKAAVQHMETDGGTGASLLGRELDDALLQLPTADRDAIVLRFFEAMDYRKVGDSLGITEEAARKKIRRALDRMEAILKSRGLTFGSVSLGASISDLGTHETPVSLLSRINTNALKSVSTIGSGSLVSMLKPALAGALMVCAGAGSTLAVQKLRSSTAASPPLASSSAPRGSASRRANPTAPSSLQSIISEIKRVHAGPGNSLNAMRLEAALDKIPTSRIPDFIELANKEFSQTERVATYEKLLLRWLDEDPAGALTYALDTDISRQVDQEGSLRMSFSGPRNILVNLNEAWIKKDTTAASGWLLAHWDHPGMHTGEPPANITMGRDLAQKLYKDSTAATMAEFVHTLPGKDQRQVLEAMAGGSSRHNFWEYAGEKKRLAFHAALQSFDHEPWQDQIVITLMQKWADRAPAELKKAIAVAEPANRFELQLGRVAVAYEFEMRNLPDGKVTSARIAVEDHALRAKEALETAAAAGLDKDAAFRLVTLAFAASGDARQALDWFDQQRAGQPMDDLLAEIVRKQAYSPSSEQTFQWAARISDAELRGSLSRGAFRMYMLSRPPAAIDKFFAETPLPAAMAAELQALRKENGR